MGWKVLFRRAQCVKLKISGAKLGPLPKSFAWGSFLFPKDEPQMPLKIIFLSEHEPLDKHQLEDL